MGDHLVAPGNRFFFKKKESSGLLFVLVVFKRPVTGLWFHLFSLLPLLGEMIQFDEQIFQRGWFNHQLDYCKHRPTTS